MPLNNFPIDVVGITIEADPTALKMDQNLSDLVDAGAARTNLDVYDTGTVDTTLGGYLLLTGGSMTGAITFDATGLQNINKGTFDNSLGGYNGISLTCAVGYELNWQGGHLTNWYSSAAQTIYIDSPIDITNAGGITFSDDSVQTTAALPITGGTLTGAVVVTAINGSTNADITFDAYNDTGAGTHFVHTFDAFTGKLNLATNGGGLTFPDSTVQTTAAVSGVTVDKALANAIAASLWYTYDGYDWIRSADTGIVNARVLSGEVSTCGISDGTSFVTGFPSSILTTSLVANADWFVSVNGTLSDFRIMNQLV